MKRPIDLETILAFIAGALTVASGMTVVNGPFMVFAVSFPLLLVCIGARLWLMGKRKPMHANTKNDE